jgi:hypothetical protein
MDTTGNLDASDTSSHYLNAGRTAMKAIRLSVLILLTVLISGVFVAPASANATTTPDLLRIRVGRHATFDRVVLDIRGAKPNPITKSFVSQLRADPSDQVVTIPGKRFLAVVAQGLSGQNYPGPRTIRTPQLRNVQAVAITGDFEAVLSVGLGLRHTSWTRIFTLTHPTRLVIDVGR